MKKIAFVAVVAAIVCSCTQKRDPASWVDVFIGTDSNIHCHPDATYPFGRLQPGPQGGNFDWDHSAGWHWGDTTLQGFNQNRMSGGVGGFGSILLMPFSRHSDPMFISHYTHEASPGYYKACLTDNGATVEVTTSPYVAMYRVRYDDASSRKVYFNFQNYTTRHFPKELPVRNYNEVEFPDDNTITGCCGGGEYFVVKFDSPVVSVDKVQVDTMYSGPQYVVDFGPGKKEVGIKVSLSLVDRDGAACDMASLPTWDFDKVKDDARAAWNEVLGTIEAEGRDEDLVKLYTAWYHSCIHPNLVSDADGRFVGPDCKIHTAPEGYYSTMGFWDIFRSVTPLYSLLIPERTAPIIETCFRQCDLIGKLPVWPTNGIDGDGMVGDHAVPTVMDAYKKGYPGVTLERTYEAVKKTMTYSRPPRKDFEALDKYGYFPSDAAGESAARTLESSYDFWCAAQLAKEAGDEEYYEIFNRRSESWRNLFDHETNFFRGRDSKGNWSGPLDPQYLCNSTNPGDYCEANAWQYLWHVIQDPEGLIQEFGGRDRYLAKLDSFFTLQPDDPEHWKVMDHKVWVGLHVPGNELSLYIPFMYSFAGRLDKTSEVVRRVCREAFPVTPAGIPGQDDQGGTSSSLVFMVLGFFPVNPASQEYILGAPQVPHAVLHLPGGDLEIVAEGWSEENFYTESVTLNGKPLKDRFTWYDIKDGGRLVFKMTGKPAQE
ncbi:MAG: GH92 family glycosyl hydrolase [Bacteroidales bacterium]|nr:GH92 family glycosyl hydrolase [Bacteroidales bacterium]